MVVLTPPGLYDVSVPLLRELEAMFERHERERVPAIVYEPEGTMWAPDGRPALQIPARLAFARLDPGDVPPAMRRWFMGAPFAIAIPEAVWRACPAHLLDLGADGRTIVLRESWDGPAAALPTISPSDETGRVP